MLHIRNELPGEGPELSKEGRLPVAPTEIVAYKRGSGETAREARCLPKSLDTDAASR